MRRLELKLPLQNAGASSCGFCFRDMAGALQCNGERGVGQRVVGSKDRESHGRGEGLVELAGIAQSANEAVMRLDVCRIGGNGGAEGLGSFLR